MDLASLQERIDQHLHGSYRVVELLIALRLVCDAGDHEATVSLERVASTGSRVMDLAFAQAMAAVPVSVEPFEQLLVGGRSVLVDVLDPRQHDGGRGRHWPEADTSIQVRAPAFCAFTLAAQPGCAIGIGYVNKHLYTCPAQPHVVCLLRR